MTNNLSYEEAIKELDKIIENLENKATLDETLNQYKKGIELYNYCNEILRKAEGEIKVIQKDRKTLEDFKYIREDDDEYY